MRRTALYLATDILITFQLEMIANQASGFATWC
ncbi:hypothetical protein ZBT109_1963 [Zymobacter palmae]|uniref:Uncharacterized protein n=1 Tax=Zymobacter palmae TaxID=33074 RepID=A0A348HGF7_9GAMM|nr:hypothetical protein ZBT109_1963 [Zymobacter palmae]